MESFSNIMQNNMQYANGGYTVDCSVMIFWKKLDEPGNKWHSHNDNCRSSDMSLLSQYLSS